MRSQAPAAEKEFWFLSGSEAVISSDAPFKTRGRVEVGENAGPLVVSTDHHLVAIASTGAIKKKGVFGGPEDWPEPGSKSTVSLIRSRSLDTLARIDVAFRPNFMGFTKDGRTLIVISLGQVHKDPKRHLAPHVYGIDAETGKVRYDSELRSEPRDQWLAESSDRLLIALAGYDKRPDAPPELVVLDTNTGALERTKLPSPALAFRKAGLGDTRYLELENAVVVVDSSGRLQGDPILAGGEKLFFLDAPDGSRSFLAGKTKKEGKLLVLEGGKITKALDVPPLKDIFFDGKGGRLFLCGSKQALVMDAIDLSVRATLTLPEDFRDVHLHPSGQRLYVNEVGDSVTVVDIPTGRQTARFASGRGGKKLLLAMAAGLASALSPYRYGLSIRMPQENVSVPTAVQAVFFSPNGKFVYVHNSTTNDITVVETEGHTSVVKVGTGAIATDPFLWSLPGGEQLLSVGWHKLMAFDTQKGTLSYEREFPKSDLRYISSLGLVFVRSKSSLEAWRPSPLEKVASLSPPEAQIMVLPNEHRVFVFSAEGTQVFDDALQSLGNVPTTGDTLRAYVVDRSRSGPR